MHQAGALQERGGVCAVAGGRKSEGHRMGDLVRWRGDDVFRLTSVMWAENCWIFAANMRRLRMLVNEVIDELMGPDMEPRHESLYMWNRSQDEDGGGKWEKHFANVVRVGVRCAGIQVSEGREKGPKELRGHLNKGMTSWWRDTHIYRAKSVPMRAKCEHVASTLSVDPNAQEQGSVQGRITRASRWYGTC